MEPRTQNVPQEDDGEPTGQLEQPQPPPPPIDEEDEREEAPSSSGGSRGRRLWNSVKKAGRAVGSIGRAVQGTYRAGVKGVNQLANSKRQKVIRAGKEGGFGAAMGALGHNVGRRVLKAPQTASRFIRNKFNLPKGFKGVATALGRMGSFAARTAIKGTVAATAIGTMGAIGLAAGAVGGDLDDMWKGLTAGVAGGYALAKGVSRKTDSMFRKRNSTLLSDLRRAHYGDKEYEEREADKSAMEKYRIHLQEKKGLSSGEARDRAKVYAKFRRLGMTDVKKMDKAYERLMQQEGVNGNRQAMSRLDFYKDQYKDELGVTDLEAMHADYQKHGGDQRSIMEDVKSYRDYHDGAGLTDLGQMGRALDEERRLAGSMDATTARRTTMGIARDLAQPSVYRDKGKNQKRIDAEVEHLTPKYGAEVARRTAVQRNQIEQRIVDPFRESGRSGNGAGPRSGAGGHRNGNNA